MSALMLAGAASAAADATTAPGPGDCVGPPGQSGLVKDFARPNGIPPGQIVSFCNTNGHGQNQGGGAVD